MKSFTLFRNLAVLPSFFLAACGGAPETGTSTDPLVAAPPSISLVKEVLYTLNSVGASGSELTVHELAAAPALSSTLISAHSAVRATASGHAKLLFSGDRKFLFAMGNGYSTHRLVPANGSVSTSTPVTSLCSDFRDAVVVANDRILVACGAAYPYLVIFSVHPDSGILTGVGSIVWAPSTAPLPGGSSDFRAVARFGDMVVAADYVTGNVLVGRLSTSRNEFAVETIFAGPPNITQLSFSDSGDQLLVAGASIAYLYRVDPARRALGFMRSISYGGSIQRARFFPGSESFFTLSLTNPYSLSAFTRNVEDDLVTLTSRMDYVTHTPGAIFGTLRGNQIGIPTGSGYIRFISRTPGGLLAWDGDLPAPSGRAPTAGLILGAPWTL